MAYSSVTGFIGTQQVALYGLPDSVSRHQPGILLDFVDNYWGPVEVMYCRAASAIRAGGLVAITPVMTATGLRYDVAEVPNTANLGKSIGVVMYPMLTGNFGWVAITGNVPINSNATVAADTAHGIAAPGQSGAVTAGKQILNSRIVAPATATVVKANCFANSGALRIQVPSTDGLFIGAYLSGTGIAATTTIVDIDPGGNFVTLSLATTTAVNGSVTATYNNGTVFYNVAYLNRAFAQGQIT